MRFQLSIYKRVLNHNAFSLLELIVVIFVISLFVGLVIPVFYKSGLGELRSDAAKIASLLRYLNDTAISRKETIPLKVSLEDGVFTWKES
jgi:prepilin-type N-terminal cleavage/methylation domain-containing protein